MCTPIRTRIGPTARASCAWVAAWVARDRLGDGLAGSFVALAAGGLVLLAVYVLLARAMRVRELTELFGRARGRTAT